MTNLDVGGVNEPSSRLKGQIKAFFFFLNKINYNCKEKKISNRYITDTNKEIKKKTQKIQ